MAFPTLLREILGSIGQAAAEVACHVEDCREFVTIYQIDTRQMIGFPDRIPYYSSCETVYRLLRFRVTSEQLEQGVNCSKEDLFGVQEVIVPTEEAVQFILQLWQVPIESLVAPRLTDIPI
jgi:hypothetical protein